MAQALSNDDLQQTSRRDLRTSRLARAEVNDAVATLDQTRNDLGIEPDRVRRTVEVALDLAEQPPLIPHLVDGYDAWQIPRLSGAWNEVRAGLEHPFTQQERPIVFDRSVAITLGDAVVHAHLRHPLVERCLRLLRAALWGSTELHLHRVTARIVPDSVLDTPALVAHARLVVTGGDGQRLHEQLVTTSGLIRNGRFSRLNVGETDALVRAETLDIEVPEPLLDDLKVLWPSVKPALNAALSNRQENLVTSLLNDVQRRQRQESDAIRAILDELRRTIERELVVKDVLQLDLFTGDDRLAAEDDREALERRLQRIPEELEQELASIQRRYTLPAPRLFPAAVTWLIPQSIALPHSGGPR